MKELSREAMKELNEWLVANQRAIEMLGQYNSEKGRGLVHTDVWVSQMEALRKLYDERMRVGVTA